MIQIIGYTALSINLISMSMNNVIYLRVLGLLANSIYVGYGIMIDAPPIYIGCSIAVILHSYRLYKNYFEKLKIETQSSP